MNQDYFPNGWVLRNLGGVEGFRPAAFFLDNLRVPVNEKERAKRPGIYPYYGANGQQGLIDDFIFDEELVLLAEDGGFFFSKSKPASYRVSGKCWVNNHAHVLRPVEDVLPDWLNICLAFADYIPFIPEPIRPKLNQKNARKIPIPVPPMDEQRRIVARVEELTRRVEEARKLRQKTIKQLSTQFFHVRRKLFESLSSEWPTKTLGKCGKVMGGGTPAKDCVDYWNGDIPWISAKEMKSFVLTDAKLKITNKGLLESSAKIIPVNSVLFVVRGSILYRYVPVAINAMPCTINQDLKAIVPHEDVDAVFLAHMLWGANDQLQNMVEEAGNTAGKLPTPSWSAFEVPIPGSEKQQAVIKELQAFQEKLSELEKLQTETAQALEMFQSALLAKAFRGEL